MSNHRGLSHVDHWKAKYPLLICRKPAESVWEKEESRAGEDGGWVPLYLFERPSKERGRACRIVSLALLSQSVESEWSIDSCICRRTAG